MADTVSVENLQVSYSGNEVVSNVSFKFKPSNLIGIIGPNGAGKSTLMKAALGLVPRDKGEVAFAGGSVELVRKNIAYVPQRADIDWDFPISVIDAVLIGRYPKLGVFRRPKKADKDFAYKCLEQVDMEEFASRQIGELSGGQQQRVFLARALAQEAEYFFFDEPFVGIDVDSEKTIITILKKLRDQGKIIFVIHHDLTTVSSYFDELILINKELIAAGPVQEVTKPEAMAKAYNMDFESLNQMGVGV